MVDYQQLCVMERTDVSVRKARAGVQAPDRLRRCCDDELVPDEMDGG